MGKLGKILAPIAAVLAIVLAVLSFLLMGSFTKYQKRSANLAETVEKAAKKLDAGSESGIGAATTFTAKAPGTKESGKLSFADYKADNGAFEKSTGNVVKLAGDVIAQRDEMSAAVAAMLTELGVSADDIAPEELNKLNSYAGLLAFAKNYIAEYKKHDAEVVKAFQDAAKIAGAANAAKGAAVLPAVSRQQATETSDESESSEDGESSDDAAATSATPALSVAYASQEKNLAQLKTNIEALQKRKMAYEAAIKGIQKGLTAYKLKANINGISGSNYEKVLMDLAQDLVAINAKLKETDALKRQLQEAQKEVASLKSQINQLNADKAELATKLDEANKRLEYYGLSRDAKKKVLKDKSEVDPETKGKVLIENLDWNYVICNLGNTKVVPNVDVVISNNGQYLASGIVKKVEEEICLVEITLRKCAYIPVGSSVYMGRGIASKTEE